MILFRFRRFRNGSQVTSDSENLTHAVNSAVFNDCLSERINWGFINLEVMNAMELSAKNFGR